MRVATLQRAPEEGLFGSIWDTIEGAADYLEETIKSVGTKIGTALDLHQYPSCEESLDTPPVKPDPLGPWTDDKGLESVRNGEGELLSKSKQPKGATAATLKLFKQALQAWGCERLGLDLLPKAGTSGPFGPETAAAVKQLQLFSGLGIDGVVGANTLAALDAYVGVMLPGEAASNAGGSKVQGKSSFQSATNPIGRIYFPTKGETLEPEDESILWAIAEAAKEADEIRFDLIGYADKRERAVANQQLSDQRATIVRYVLDELLAQRKVNASIAWHGAGEIERPQKGETDEALKGFRRVDIHVTKVVYPPEAEYCTGLLCFEVKPEPEKKNCLAYPAQEWQAALENLQVEGKGLVWTSAQVIIRMKHPNEEGIRWQYTYLYSGWGGGGDLEIGGKVGGKIGGKIGGKAGKKLGKKIGKGIDDIGGEIDEASDWVPVDDVEFGDKWFNFRTSKPVKITDFKGPATHKGFSAAAGPSAGKDTIVVSGLKNVDAEEVELKWYPLGIGVGINASWNLSGELRHFRGGGCRQVHAGAS